MLRNLIPSRLLGASNQSPQDGKGRWSKRLLILTGFILGIVVLGHLGVRFVLWPQIEKSKPTLEKFISARLGADIAIDDLQVSWVGLRPEFQITGLRFHGTDKSPPLLEIEKISGELSWLSFYHLEPYFHQLNFNGARIYAKRDAKGVISIAGIPIHGKPNDFAAENWLLAQDDIKVSQVQFFWDDLQSKKLSTSIQFEEFNLSNGLRKHRASMIATTPWYKDRLQINADFVHRLGGQAGNWKDWIGEFNWNFAELDLNQVAKDFNVPLYALGGTISSKGRMNLDRGKPDGGAFSIAAKQLKIQLIKDEEPIEFGKLESELVQETDGRMLSVSTKSLAWQELGIANTAPLENLSPMTFKWRPPKDSEEIKEFGFSSPQVDVKDVALFALNLPLSKKVRQWIKASKAEGELKNLEINWAESQSALAALSLPSSWINTNKLDFSVSAQLRNLSFVGMDKTIPSVSNLSGNLTGDQNQGNLSLSSSNLELVVNDFLVEPKIKLDKASGQISWMKSKGNWVINAKQLSLSNPEINTTLNASYLIGGPKQADQITLDMNFAQAKLASAYRYLPVGMDSDTKQYLGKAFGAGLIQNGSLHIKGDPNQIPFSTDQAGEFSLNLPLSNASFKPAPLLDKAQGEWPGFTNLIGEIKMNQAALNVNVSKAGYQDVALSNVVAAIPNVSAKQLILTVNGNAQGEAHSMLNYLFASPLGKKQPSLEKNLELTGQANLNLALKVPLSGKGDVKVDAKLDLPNNRAQWASLPPLENLKGKIRITEVNPEFEDVTADFLGGSIKITSNPSTADSQSFAINGNIDGGFIKQYFSEDLNPQVRTMLSAMSGSAKYQGMLNFNKAGSETNLKFDLKNWSSQIPEPLNKAAGAPMLGALNVKTFANSKASNAHLSWSAKIGDQITTQGSLGLDNEWRFALGIGAAAIIPPQGFALNLQAPELNGDRWHDFLSSGPAPKKAKSASVSEDNFALTAQFKKLILLDRIWTDANLTGSSKNDIWQFRINSPQVAGQLQWQGETSANPSGFISGRLSKLRIPDAQAIAKPAVETATTPSGKSWHKNHQQSKTPFGPNSIPSANITIDDFSWAKAQLGAIKIKSQTSKDLLKLESLQISNPQGDSTLSGQWASSQADKNEHSSLNINMNVKDAGQIIGHWTSAKSVEGGQGKLDGQLEWDGPLFKPDYGTLSGKIHLNLNKGRLLEVNSDAAKLLNVLSLQSLFRFATLDLQGSLGNIVTKGTPFNTIQSSFSIQSGIAHANEFTMELDQARVAITGDINIPKENQDLRVTVFPTIDAAAGSVVAAFMINPIVGLSALVGQYLITNQINRAMQTDYLVQGSWTEPEIIPLDQKGQPIDAKTMESIRSKGLLKEQVKPSAPNSAPNNTPSTINPTAPA